MLEVLDTAGQEEYTALQDQWIRDGEGFVLVYSITSRSSFTKIQKIHSQIRRVKDPSNAGSPTIPSYWGAQLAMPPPTGPVPVMLVGNKSDKVTERAVSSQEGQALARELGCEFVEASAKNCINVEKAYYDVVRALRRGLTPPVKRPNGIPTGVGLSSMRDRNADPSPTTSKKNQHKTKCVIL